MLKIKNYVKAESLEQAYELNQKPFQPDPWRNALDEDEQCIRSRQPIDLSGLGLNEIEETDESFRIGCMVTLRQLELHEGLNTWFDHMMQNSVKDIVGVQFRNLATVGGSIFGRFGFSDVLTAFLALDTEVELFHAGILPLREFVTMPRDNDILVRLIVKKDAGRLCVSLPPAMCGTDFPVLAAGFALHQRRRCVLQVGARPKKAMLLTVPEDTAAKIREGVCSEEEIAGTAAFAGKGSPHGK